MGVSANRRSSGVAGRDLEAWSPEIIPGRGSGYKCIARFVEARRCGVFRNRRRLVPCAARNRIPSPPAREGGSARQPSRTLRTGHCTLPADHRRRQKRTLLCLRTHAPVPARSRPGGPLLQHLRLPLWPSGAGSRHLATRGGRPPILPRSIPLLRHRHRDRAVGRQCRARQTCRVLGQAPSALATSSLPQGRLSPIGWAARGDSRRVTSPPIRGSARPDSLPLNRPAGPRTPAWNHPTSELPILEARANCARGRAPVSTPPAQHCPRRSRPAS